MGKGRYAKQKRQPWKVLVLLILIVILCVAAVGITVWKWNNGIALGNSTNESSGTNSETSSETSSDTSSETSSDTNTSTTDANTNSDNTQPVSESTTGETLMVVQEEEAGPTVVITDKKQASYEEWLAAGTVVAVSIEYPTFDLKGIYLTGETALTDKQNSSGVYVVFDADGMEQAVHAFPLDKERTEAGTTDLYTMDLGFAAFEPVEVQSIDTAAYRQVGIEDLQELIAQSLLVSLYEH